MAYVIERPVRNDVQATRWIGYAKGATHAFNVPAGPLESPTGDGKIESVCGTKLEVARLVGEDRRCKKCTAILVPDPERYGKPLSERQIEPVATGLVDGDPRAAELRRKAEVEAISGDARKLNAEIADVARQGRREAASELARDLDRRGPAAPVPVGPSQAARKGVSTAGAGRSAGQRGEARADGVALVQGANMAPVQPRSGWIAKAGTLAMPLGRERADRGALGRPLTPHVSKGDNAVQACVEMRCAHIVGDLPADRTEAITYREYAKLSRTRQRRMRERIARVQAEIKRERAFAATQPVKVHPGRKSEGDRPEIEELMTAPGKFADLDWAERKAMTVR